MEKCDGDSINKDGVSIDQPIPDSCTKEKSDTNVIQIDDENSGI